MPNPATGTSVGDLAMVRSTRTSRRSSFAGDAAPPSQHGESMERITDGRSGGARSDRSRQSYGPTDMDLEQLRMRERAEEREHEFRMAQLKLQTVQAESSRNTSGSGVAASNQPAERVSRRSWRAELFSERMKGIPKLAGLDNFSNWSFRVHQAAMDAGIVDHLTDSIPRPDHDHVAEQNAWTEDRSAISGGIYAGVAEPILPHLKHLGHNASPKTLWDELQHLYAGRDSNRLSGILDDIMSATYSDSEDFDTWLATLRERWTSLIGTDYAIHERVFGQCVLRAMPSSFDVPIAVLRQTPEDQRTYNQIVGSLREHHHSQKRAGRIPSMPSNSVGAYVATRGFTHIPPPPLKFKRTGEKDPDFASQNSDRCHACWGKGHTMNQKACTHYEARVANGWYTPNRERPKKQKSKQANAAETDDHDAEIPEVHAAAVHVSTVDLSGNGGFEVLGNFAGGFAASVEVDMTTFEDGSIEELVTEASFLDLSSRLEAAAACDSRPEEFLLDTGAQVHVSYLKECFTSLSPLSHPISIKGIGGAIVRGEHIGEVMLPVINEGNTTWIRIKGVIYAPGLGRNLISLGRLLVHNGIRLDWDSHKLTTRDGHPLCQTRFRNFLFTLQVNLSLISSPDNTSQAYSATTAMTWHKRMNHLGVSGMHALSSSQHIPKFSEKDLKSISSCESCLMAKSTRLPFDISTSKSSRPLELVHSDLCGPISTAVGGYRYIASFIDDHTRVAWVFLLKHKDDFLNAFKTFLAFVERQSGHKLQTLRTDGGGEYVSSAMKAFLADDGIQHQITAPNSSQQNGVAEHFNRTLLDRIRALLIESGMLDGWWAEAALSVVYVLNRTPHASLKFCIPLEVWSNKPISLATMRVFGSKCFTVDTYKTKGKLTKRAIECRFLGYNGAGKCWRVQVTGTTKVLRSRNVRFIESASPTINPSILPPACPPQPEVDDRPEGIAFSPPAAPIPSDSVGEISDSVGEPDEDLDSARISDALRAPLENPPPGFEVPKPRRSSRNKNRSSGLNTSANVAPATLTPPKSFRDAMKRPDAESWRTPVAEEFDQWEKLDVYEVVPRTQDMEVIPTLGVFSEKTDENGNPIRKKFRCVARGDLQSQGTSTPTFSPVASAATLRALAAKAAQSGGHFYQMDVTTAFLHASLKETVYLSIPQGFPRDRLLNGVPVPQQVLKLKKAVYGLQESSRAWYDHLSGALFNAGFTRSVNDNCLFWVKCPNSDTRAFVLVYVDDLTLYADTTEEINWLRGLLSSTLHLKDLGEATQFLGLEIVRDHSKGTITLLQRKFIRNLLSEFNLLDCRPMETPMFANALSTLPNHETPLTDSEAAYMRDKSYRSLLGSLNWVGLGTRPDICYALARLGQAQSNPHPAHWQALCNVLRYLSATLDMGLTYSKDTKDPHMYTDSAYADCPFTRKSHSGFLVIAGGAAINWCSRKQSIVTTSSTEAEYVAMGHAAKEARWIGRILDDLQMRPPGPMRIYADSQSSIILADSERLSARTKHLDPQYHFIRQEVKTKVIEFSWVPSLSNAADCLTKPLGPALFKRMPPLMGLPWVRRQYTPNEHSGTDMP